MNLSTTWFKEEELIELAKEYAAQRGMKMDRWAWIKLPSGTVVCKGWRQLLSIMFRMDTIDWIDYRERGEYGRWYTVRRYFLNGVTDG